MRICGTEKNEQPSRCQQKTYSLYSAAHAGKKPAAWMSGAQRKFDIDNYATLNGKFSQKGAI